MAEHPNRMPRRLLLFVFLPLFPLPELPLSFLALKEFLYLREQYPGQGLHLVERDAGAVVIGFLLCQMLSSVSNFTKVRSLSSRVLCRLLLLGSVDRLSLPCCKIMYRRNENLAFSHSSENIVSDFGGPVKANAGRKSKARKTRYHGRFTIGF